MYGERMPYIHRHVVCVCVSEQKGKPSCSTGGGWEIEWPYIHKDMVCVCVWQQGKPSCSTGGGAGSPSSLGEAEGYPVPQGGGGRGDTP